MELTEDQIQEINEKAPTIWQENEQGIFKEPFGIPTHIKTLVIYMRYETGGVRGGSCWDSSNPQEYMVDKIPSFEVLDLTLKAICPDLSYLDYKGVEKLVQSTDYTDHEYYGNCTDFEIKYLVMEDLIHYLKQL